MIKCKVCGCEFTPVIDKHYVAVDNGESGISTVLRHVEGNLYDAFDCPACGCQIITQERKRTFFREDFTLEEVNDDDEDKCESES